MCLPFLVRTPHFKMERARAMPHDPQPWPRHLLMCYVLPIKHILEFGSAYQHNDCCLSYKDSLRCLCLCQLQAASPFDGKVSCGNVLVVFPQLTHSRSITSISSSKTEASLSLSRLKNCTLSRLFVQRSKHREKREREKYRDWAESKIESKIEIVSMIC